MNDWLYAKDGYYTSFRTIGKEGDFYTAVSTSMFFGGSISKRFIDTIEEGFLPPDTTLLEIGAHQGYLLADMAQFIYTLKPELLKSVKFAIIEPHEQNRKAQKEYFEKSFGSSIELIHYSDIKEVRISNAFIVANELFDAFACELIKDGQMLVIEDFKPEFQKCDESIVKTAEKYSIERGEVAVGYEEFARKLSQNIAKFEFVTFDYGEKKARNDFSIRVYKDHKVYPFFELTDFVNGEKEDDVRLEDIFKKSDITYDVNFEHLIGAFKEAGAENILLDSQMAALVEFGLIDLLEMLKKNADEKKYDIELNRVKTLIDPSFMGERFKAAIFRKRSLDI